MARFEPEPAEHITIAGVPYEVMPHPTVPAMAYGQEGRKGIIYQLSARDGCFALKVFKQQFRHASLVDTCRALDQLALAGLDVCHRHCITRNSDTSLISRYPDIEYAIVMPWMAGSTWHDIVLAKTIISESSCRKLAKNAADVLASLEARGYAHCDVAGSNVVVSTGTGKVNLIDVEDMYGPGLALASAFPRGTEGYEHVTSRQLVQGQWCAAGDRFSAAILFAEMLGWHDARVRQAADDEHFFACDDLQRPTSAQYILLLGVLAAMSQDAADLFACAWASQSLDDCPTLADWAKVLEFSIVAGWLPIATPPPPPPYYPQTWDPLPPQPEVRGSSYTFSFMPLQANQPPPVPAYFRISRSSAGFELRWLASPGADSYLIEAADNEQFSAAVTAYDGQDLEWTTSALPSVVRWYRIRAYNGKGTSAWSEPARNWL